MWRRIRQRAYAKLAYRCNMDDLSCKICYIVFDAKVTIPKILPCGHNLCIICLQNVLQTSKACAICRKDLYALNASEYPTVFALLSIIESGQVNMNMEFAKIVPTLVSRADKALTFLTEDVSGKQTQVDRIKRKRELLEELHSGKKEKLNEDVPAVLKAAVKDLEEELCILSAGAPGSPQNRNLNLEDFATKGYYWNEIYDRFHNNERLYVVHKIKGIDKYGHLSLTENERKILVHCMNETKVPSGDFSLLKFDDLRQCALPCDFPEAFLQFRCTDYSESTTVMVGTESTACGQAFVKLCTGETGESYIGCCYCKYERDSASTFRIRVEAGDRAPNINQISTEANLISVKNNNILLVDMKKTGDFEIVWFNKTETQPYPKVEASSIIGKIPFDLYTLPSIKNIGSVFGIQKRIVGCGIVFNF